VTERFAPAVDAWRQGLGKVRNAVRQELVARQLDAHLPPPHAGMTVLDAGCGQGTQAIRLARAGYNVRGIDLSEDLLELASRTAAAEPEDVRARIRFDRLDVLDLDRHRDSEPGFDVVCCHGVVMYLPTLEQGLASLIQALRPGGLLSVVTRNRAGIAMRAGISGDWKGALDGFDARLYTNRLGLTGVRADEPAEVATTATGLGAELVAWYGVRLWTDHWALTDVPDDETEWNALLAAEEEAGRRDPYRAVTALTHTLAVRGPGPS
jgi:SAM-dependent methyltransferase